MPTKHLALPEDLCAVEALINHAYEVEAFFVTGPRVQREDILRRISAGEVVTIRDAKRIVATAHVAVLGSCAHLGLVAVEPSMQSRGLGRRIVALAEELAHARGASEMRLQVVHLREELPPFYRSLGYREVGTSQFVESKGTIVPVHFIDMKKHLGPLPVE